MTSGTHFTAASSLFLWRQGIEKKANSQKLGDKNKSNKGKVYSSQRLTCGSHEPAGSLTFQRRHEIERKRQVPKYQEPKIIQEKTLLYIEDDMRDPFSSSGLNVSKAARDQKKKEVARNQGVKKSKNIFQLRCILPSGPSNYRDGRLLTRTISAHSKTWKSYVSQNQKTRRFNI
jgi:hypothetical protein